MKLRMEVFSGDPPCPGCTAILALADEYARKYKGKLEVIKSFIVNISLNFNH